jgi:hypothetical protein
MKSRETKEHKVNNKKTNKTIKQIPIYIVRPADHSFLKKHKPSNLPIRTVFSRIRMDKSGQNYIFLRMDNPHWNNISE